MQGKKIVLTNEELRDCRQSAKRLTEETKNLPDSEGYIKEKMKDNFYANFRAKRVEYALAKYLELGFDFHIHKEQDRHLWKGNVDVGQHIECKATDYMTYGPAIKRKDFGRIIVAGWLGRDPELVLLTRWVYANNKSDWIERRNDRGSYFTINADKCNDMDRDAILKLQEKIALDKQREYQIQT